MGSTAKTSVTLALLSCGVSLGLLAGCGSPQAAAPASTGGMSMPAHGTTAPAPPVSTNNVAIKNFAFVPAAITVRKGITVTWTNQDQEAHTVTSTRPANELRSPTLNTGGTYRHTFTTAGTYAYLCTIHPFMTATVVVAP